MPWNSGEVASGNGYTYFPCNGAIYVTITALNAAIDWSPRRQGEAYPSQDELLANGSVSRPLVCDEIRFKSHAIGTPAEVTISAQTDLEVPQGRPLSGSISDSLLHINPLSGIVTAEFQGIVNALPGSVLPVGSLSGLILDAQIAAVGAAKITGQLTDAQIAALAATKITGTLSDAQLAAISAAKILGQLSDAQIIGLSASKLLGQILDSQINGVDASKILNQIVNAQVASLATAKLTGTVDASNIITGLTIVGALIAGGTITANKLTVAQLDAITANMGVLTAGIIRGGAIETQAADPKVRFDNTGFFITNASGVKEVNLTSLGLAILASTTTTPPSVRAIDFLSPTDGFQTGDIFGLHSGSNRSVSLRGLARVSTDTAKGALFATDQLGNSASVIASAKQGAPSAYDVTADANGQVRKIIDAAGASDFVQDNTAWTTATLLNGYADLSGTDRPVEYRKVGEWVEIRGAVRKTGASANLPVFQLPAGSRPATKAENQSITGWLSPAYFASQLAISTAGDVVAYSNGGVSTAVGTQFYFGHRFRIAG